MNKDDLVKYGCDQLLGLGNLESITNIFSSNYTAHAGDKEYKGHDFIKRFTKQIRVSIPDLTVVKVEILAHDSNTVTWQRTLSGTHKTSLRGIPPSGKKVTWVDIVVSRFEDGKIAEEWVVSELAEKLLLNHP